MIMFFVYVFFRKEGRPTDSRECIVEILWMMEFLVANKRINYNFDLVVESFYKYIGALHSAKYVNKKCFARNYDEFKSDAENIVYLHYHMNGRYSDYSKKGRKIIALKLFRDERKNGHYIFSKDITWYRYVYYLLKILIYE